MAVETLSDDDGLGTLTATEVRRARGLPVSGYQIAASITETVGVGSRWLVRQGASLDRLPSGALVFSADDIAAALARDPEATRRERARVTASKERSR